MKRCFVKGRGNNESALYFADSASVHDGYLYLLKTARVMFEDTTEEGPFWNRRTTRAHRIREYETVVAVFTPNAWDSYAILEDDPDGETEGK